MVETVNQNRDLSRRRAASLALPDHRARRPPPPPAAAPRRAGRRSPVAGQRFSTLFSISETKFTRGRIRFARSTPGGRRIVKP